MNKERKQQEDQLKDAIVQAGNLPIHVAIIMDGNGRWARSRGLPRVEGHREGINSVREVVKVAGEIGIQYLTLYTFSTENWHRPQGEVSALMSLLLETIRAEVEELNRNNVKLMTIGRLEDLPFLARRGMLEAIRRLKNNTGLTLNLALSYSSRREITDAVKKLVDRAAKGQLKPEDVTEELISANLYTADIPDPDLLIRTSGELRVSNFLLWQLAYTEIYVTEIYWPDFRRLEFLKAIQCYQHRERRFGKVSEQVQAEKASNHF
ncbi:MAG: isoprenyl transferase [Calditrichaeota bacterium]|nr:MAG: isoprenyl transferase [Calditrichota bacterium]